ncbi:S-adenosyl-L-methionine-dependent methyltransferase [Trichocladium antarcticum]|uniref:S-adenosyl-L-methionine-dependent methyltransferase n=1 Tax=Trichocladium antarcticum TaxID=1450529 RepID=A0AAN6ZBU0_9PEZI|nr:S-adenosyl-L-methionine-dependent methyltransferase [Trichocladium antarcticum]
MADASLWASAGPRPLSPTMAPGATRMRETEPYHHDDDFDFDAQSVLTVLNELDGEESDTTSLDSGIFRFREENGRTYHAYKEGRYYMPNDKQERDRLDLSHEIFLKMFDGQLYISPAGRDGRPLGRVFDGGCGTGVWSIELADEHPDTAVVGVDLSPIQPSCVPPNVEFFVDDLEEDWAFADDFDFIYARMLNGSIRDWPGFARQAYSNLRPGGWIELCDPCNPLRSDDGTLPADCPLSQWSALQQEGSRRFGAPLDGASRHKQCLVDAGFRNVVQVEYRWPTNPWPSDPKQKDIGQWCLVNALVGLQASSLRIFTGVLGWSATELEGLLAGVRKDLENPDIHAYWPVYVVYGQKPGGG